MHRVALRLVIAPQEAIAGLRLDAKQMMTRKPGLYNGFVRPRNNTRAIKGHAQQNR